MELILLSLWVAVFAGYLGAAVVWSGPEEFALFTKVAKFIVYKSGVLRLTLHPLQ